MLMAVWDVTKDSWFLLILNRFRVAGDVSLGDLRVFHLRRCGLQVVNAERLLPAFAIPGFGRLDANITLFSTAGLLLVAGAAALAAAA